MCSNEFIEHITLADEEISTARCVEQRICPFRVAGVANDLSFELDPIGETWPGLVVVTNMEWSYRKRAGSIRTAVCGHREKSQRITGHTSGASLADQQSSVVGFFWR